MQQDQSPIAAIKQICASKKMLILTLFYTFIAVGGAFAVFRSAIDLNEISLFGLFEIDLAKYLDKETFRTLQGFLDTLFVFQIIGILPDVAAAISFWMIRSGTAPGNAASVRINRGLVLPKVALFIKGFGRVIVATVVFILTILAALGIGAATTKVWVSLVIVLVGLLIAAYFVICARYYVGLASVLIGVSHTLQTGKALVTCGRFLPLFNWLMAIVTALGAFGKAPLAMFTTFFEALVFLCVALLLSDIKKTVGIRTQKEAQEIMVIIRDNPAYASTAELFGFKKSTVEESKLKLIGRMLLQSVFGTKVAPIEGELVAAGEMGKVSPAAVAPSAAPVAEPQKSEPATTHTTASFTFSGTSFVSSAAAPIAPTAAVSRPTVGADTAASLLAPQALCLFDARMEEIPDRYSVLGDTEYERGVGCPLPLYRVQVLKDKISEKKLLRLAFYAPAVPVVGARMNVLLGGACGETVGIMRDLCFTEEYLGAEMPTATLGFLLPDGVAVGEVTVTSVSLADGLDWEKGSAPYAFSVQKEEAVAAYESAEAVRATYAYAPSLPPRALALFSSSPSELDARYTLLGELKLAPAEDGPLHLQAVQLVRDGVSEKKLLRLAFYPSSLPIVGARIDIVLRNAYADIIGVIRDFPLTEEHIDADGNIQTARFGFLLPDDVACGEILVASVSLSDGLLWAKGSAYYSFTTEETRVADVEHFCRTVRAKAPTDDEEPNLLAYRGDRETAYLRTVCVREGETPLLEVVCMNASDTVIRCLSLSVTYTDTNGCETVTAPVTFDRVVSPLQCSEKLVLPLPEGVTVGRVTLRVSADSFERPSLCDSAWFATYEKMVEYGAAWRRSPATAPTATASIAQPRSTVLDTPTAEEPTLSATAPTEPSANSGKQSVLPLLLSIASAVIAAALVLTIL